MGMMQKLLRRDTSHEAWLAAHPDKTSTHQAPPMASDEDRARTRAQMEAELDAQRAARSQ